MTKGVRITTIIALFTIGTALALFAIGLAWPTSPFGAAMTGDHPVRILLTMAVVLAIIWTSYQFIQRSPARPEHPVYWGFALFVMLAATTASLCGEFRRWPLITEKPYVDFVRVFALAGPLLFMTCMVFRPFVNPPDKPVHSAEGVQSWGRLTSVLIVLLAIFAFGIEVKDVPIVDTGNKAGIQIVDKGNKAGIQSTPSVRWAELPAILIVFLLAEMGLELVVLSIDSREAMLIANKSMDETKLATASAAARATEAVGHLKDATGAFGGAKTDALKAIDELHSWTKTYAQISEELIKGGKQFPTLLGFVDKESEKKYWERLFLFARSWIPDPHPSQETGRLIGELFITFMGSSVGTGSVRRSANSISCITADAVFAEASKRWLEQMAQKPDGQLVVWALTTLLPTEFAFPSAYRGSGDLSASRIKSLNHFTDAVMRSCLKKEVADYRRITVFEKSKATVLEKLVQKVRGDRCSLDHWFIWDTRVARLKHGVSEPNQNLDAFKEFAKNVLRAKGPYDGMRRTSLEEIFSKAVADEPDQRPSIFPYHSSSSELSLFTINLDLPGSEGDGEKMAVFGPVADSLTSPNNSSQSLIAWLKSEHWQSLREWYCTDLHTSSDAREAAWWVALDDKSKDLLKNFSLDWDSTNVTTLDLLLIGSRKNSNKKEDIDWHGAAISNLSFNRTECTVQLVTNLDRLEPIANAVKVLCNDFTAPTDREIERPVQSFGRWSSWPVPDWPSPVPVVSQVNAMGTPSGGSGRG